MLYCLLACVASHSSCGRASSRLFRGVPRKACTAAALCSCGARGRCCKAATRHLAACGAMQTPVRVGEVSGVRTASLQRACISTHTGCCGSQVNALSSHCFAPSVGTWARHLAWHPCVQAFGPLAVPWGGVSLLCLWGRLAKLRLRRHGVCAHLCLCVSHSPTLVQMHVVPLMTGHTSSITSEMQQTV